MMRKEDHARTGSSGRRKANGRVQSGDEQIPLIQRNLRRTAKMQQMLRSGKACAYEQEQHDVVFGAIALIGVGGAGFFLMKKERRQQ
ncbi:MAG: hypothetical protein ACLST1_06065 [[Eubacterium] siraeum]